MGEELEKVISTKITTKKYELLEKYAREFCIQKKIEQPTVSVLLRTIIGAWLTKLENNDEEKKAQTNMLTSTSTKTGLPAMIGVEWGNKLAN